jgi:NAD(P)-dependent dehydrogenase (short-subunit alcohol dehydrogenase family)
VDRSRYFSGKHALVTGAGSGIGAALSRALVDAGAHVVCTDIDLDAACRTAESCTGKGSARAVHLDVTDPDAVAAAVDDVIERAGVLDMIFNNAGISWGGDTELLTMDHWNRIVDINIRGVVHGVAAAYPVMVRQGHGHIVNTASMGGLVAAGLITSYVMTKHAVVGLSLALRSEAAGRGVKVLALCPSAVETPILDSGAVGRFGGRDYYLTGQGVKTALGADVLAQQALTAMVKNRGLLVTPNRARGAWLFARLFPRAMQAMAAKFVVQQRKSLDRGGSPSVR